MMRFGVPDAKLEKRVIDRRVGDPRAGGDRVRLRHRRRAATSPSQELKDRHDAVVVAIGSRVSRDLDAPGPRASAGSTSRWTTSTSATAGWPRRRGGRSRAPEPGTEITAAGKKVIVIGGGDTGMDCISNSHREGAAERGHARRLRGAPRERAATPGIRGRCRPSARRRTYALDEGGKRRWGTEVTGFGGRDGPRQPRVRAEGDRHLLARPDAGARERVRARGRPGADRDRVRGPRARGADRAARSRARPSRQHPHRA